MSPVEVADDRVASAEFLKEVTDSFGSLDELKNKVFFYFLFLFFFFGGGGGYLVLSLKEPPPPPLSLSNGPLSPTIPPLLLSHSPLFVVF